jgi:hypothetical protein
VPTANARLGSYGDARAPVHGVGDGVSGATGAVSADAAATDRPFVKLDCLRVVPTATAYQSTAAGSGPDRPRWTSRKATRRLANRSRSALVASRDNVTDHAHRPHHRRRSLKQARTDHIGRRATGRIVRSAAHPRRVASAHRISGSAVASCCF